MVITARRILLELLRRCISVSIEHGWNGCDCCGHWVIGMVLSSLRDRTSCDDNDRRRVSIQTGSFSCVGQICPDPDWSWRHRESHIEAYQQLSRRAYKLTMQQSPRNKIPMGPQRIHKDFRPSSVRGSMIDRKNSIDTTQSPSRFPSLPRGLLVMPLPQPNSLPILGRRNPHS
jgi:hypothetical protein